jgi:hypothetical protein
MTVEPVSPETRDAIFASLADGVLAGDVEPVWIESEMDFRYCTSERAAELRGDP